MAIASHENLHKLGSFLSIGVREVGLAVFVIVKISAIAVTSTTNTT